MKERRQRLLLVLSAIAALIAVAGCARFSTKQTDLSYEGDNPNPTRAITTKATATTFFSAKSDLAKFKAMQTDKTQSASVGALSQEGGQTNQVGDIAARITEAAIRAAKTP